MSLSATVRNRLDAQGYVDVDETTLAAVAPWVRWSPAICATIIIAGTALASVWVLGALVPFALTGAVMRRHPFDYI